LRIRRAPPQVFNRDVRQGSRSSAAGEREIIEPEVSVAIVAPRRTCGGPIVGELEGNCVHALGPTHLDLLGASAFALIAAGISIIPRNLAVITPIDVNIHLDRVGIIRQADDIERIGLA